MSDNINSLHQSTLQCYEVQHLLQRMEMNDLTITYDEVEAFSLHLTNCDQCAQVFYQIVGVNNKANTTKTIGILCHANVELVKKDVEARLQYLFRYCSDLAKAQEKELLAKISQGHATAFNFLYQRYKSELVRYINRYYHSLGQEMSEEIADEALLQIWLRRSQIFSIQRLSPYLRTIARNIAIDRMRNDLTAHQPLNEELYATHKTPILSMEAQELADQIHKAVTALSQTLRIVFEMKQRGLSAREAAAQLGCTQNAARRRLQKAQKKLDSALSYCGTCSLNHQEHSDCPAQKQEVYCLKYLYHCRYNLSRKKK